VLNTRSIDLLIYDHRTIERGLDLLQTVVSKLEKKEKVSTEVFKKLIRFFREFADKYDPSPFNSIVDHLIYAGSRVLALWRGINFFILIIIGLEAWMPS
jgi:hypothetical protein